MSKKQHKASAEQSLGVENLSAFDSRCELEMSVLYDISKAVVNGGKVSDIIAETLEILNTRMGLVRGTITLREGDLLFIEASHGISDASAKRGVYKIGEGVTGRVAAECASVILDDISKSTEFLDRTKSRGKSLSGIAFICVPIIYMEQAIGTLSIDIEKRGDAGADLQRCRELLETIANILADAISSIYLRHLESDSLMNENRQLRMKFGGSMIRPKNMVGNCGAMQKIYEAMASFYDTSAPVMIFGAAGTGKELCAREICAASHEFKKSFHIVNCATLSTAEAVRELFGVEDTISSGIAFQGIGILERFRNSTIFFDEIAEIPMDIARKLSGILESGTFRRIDSNSDIKCRVRMIFASCADLSEIGRLEIFKLPAFAALLENALFMPALKDRKSDILLLSEHFLEKFNAVYNKKIKRISTPAINMLTVYPWSGNVRELENCIEHAVESSNDSAISGYDLSAQVRASYSNKSGMHSEDIDFLSMVQSFERELITEALKASAGKAAPAARKLALTERVLNYKIKKYSIVPAWYKNR